MGLPVVPGGSQSQIVNSTLKHSIYWPQIQVLWLEENFHLLHPKLTLEAYTKEKDYTATILVMFKSWSSSNAFKKFESTSRTLQWNQTYNYWTFMKSFSSQSMLLTEIKLICPKAETEVVILQI
ncbi:hypothetical protein HOY80DRAFT_1005789 [Tuber brumale]|nr:hypothetical protein HOY80DRAFT_1005789 [Tuber brumale]